jgi:hypothetical protein
MHDVEGHHYGFKTVVRINERSLAGNDQNAAFWQKGKSSFLPNGPCKSLHSFRECGGLLSRSTPSKAFLKCLKGDLYKLKCKNRLSCAFANFSRSFYRRIAIRLSPVRGTQCASFEMLSIIFLWAVYRESNFQVLTSVGDDASEV